MTVQQLQPAVEERLQQERSRLREALARLENGEAVGPEQLQGIGGVCTRPTSWHNLGRVVQDGSEAALATLGRSIHQLRDYFHYRDQVILSQFVSIADYLLCKVYGVPAALAAGGKKAAAPLADFHSAQRIVWRENDSPYWLEEGIEHHCVWATQPLAREQLQQVIAQHRRGYETLHFVNPPRLMSVPELWHAHVLSRRR